MSESDPLMPGMDLPEMAAPSAAQPYRVLARKYRPQTFADLIGQVRGKLGDRFLRIELAEHLAPKTTPFRVPSGLGEALDVLYDDRPLGDRREAQIVEAYLRKTARYSVSGPLVLGATLAGAPPAIEVDSRQVCDLPETFVTVLVTTPAPGNGST